MSLSALAFSPGKRFFVFGSLALAILWATSALWASGADSDPPSANPDSATTTPGADDESPLPAIQLDEAPPQPGLGERVNGVFESIVGGMAKVLFYRVLPSERQFVQMDHLEYYVRNRDSKGPFERYDPKGTLEDPSLDAQEAEALKARGILILGPDGRFYRNGLIGDRAVDYVTVVVDNKSKYVKVTEGPNAGNFVKLLRRREEFSEEPKDVLTPEQVERLGRRGWLKIDEQAKKRGDATPYILSEPTGGAPVVVLWLACGAIFFTFYMRFFNIWGFRHALDVVRGKYDDPNEPGEVTHFQALSSALSATVGLGNIAGVTIAMATGGPGAFFWMMACGIFGMSSKFVECTLGQMYRQVKPDGTVLGGPMQYLYDGLKTLKLGGLGLVLSVVFAIMCILASFGGGNMFQANQAGSQVLAMIQKAEREELAAVKREIRQVAEAEEFDKLAELQQQQTSLEKNIESFGTIFKPVFGIVLAALVGIVILGGIKRIGAAASRLVPTMCGVYIAACLYIIFRHIGQVPEMVGLIFSEAFTGDAFAGGFLGVLVIGVQRAAFSNEAGVGSAAIAHSAAKTDQPIREGAVALLEPFIDTVVVCSMTALVILLTGAWDNQDWIVGRQLEGAALTSMAFESELSWFPYVLTVAVVLFAYSTIISWSYYGERSTERLFGQRATYAYKAVYVLLVILGAVANLGAVLDFSDMMILSMAFPNILGLLLLCPQVRRALLKYWEQYKRGEFVNDHG